METALITGDWQVPCHDPSAFEVMLQIAEDLKPDQATLNGDIVEWRHLSTHYLAKALDKFGQNARQETITAKEMMLQFKRRSKAKKIRFNEGNHEWRLARAFNQSPALMQLMGIEDVKKSLSVATLLSLDDLGIEWVGEYPAGHWLFDRQVFVHHSYQVRKKAGYMAHTEIEGRLTSVITGHGERLACVWRRGMERELFACEGGNLSILGEPKKGQGIYGSIPFNQPEFLDRRQGFVILYREGNLVVPECVPIHQGRAIWRGRLYKA